MTVCTIQSDCLYCSVCICHPVQAAVYVCHPVQAAVLHDTVEDTQTTLDEIGERFGAEVRGLVDEVSDDKSLPKMERKRLQVRDHQLLLYST